MDQGILTAWGSPGWWATNSSKGKIIVISTTLRSLVAVAAILVAVGIGGSRAQAADIAYVATDVLNLRDAPSADGAILDTLLWGEDVKIVAGPTADNWFQVVNQEMTGWVAGEYLSWQPVGAYDALDAVGNSAGRWIDVDRSSGAVTLYDGGSELATFWGAFGWDLTDDGYYATANGTYAIYAMNAELTWSEPGQVSFTHWVAFDPDRANGFHSFSMDEEGYVTAGIETPTGGSVALILDAAAELFAFAEVGMTVQVHW